MTAVASVTELDVVTTDGRRLHVYDGGDPAGALVVAHHGTPSAGLLAADWHAEARASGVRLVAFDRAGYGGSDRQPGRRIADAAPDTAAVVDALGASSFATWGISGGGPHALACAALLPSRVVAVSTLAGVAPYHADGLDFLAGMGQDNLDEFGAALDGPAALSEYLAAQRSGLLATSPEQLRDALDSLLPEVDRACLTGARAEFLHASFVRALASGADGWMDDDLAFVASWGFEPEDIEVPVLVLQGEQDKMVPFDHGRWLASRISTAEVRLSAEHGHLTLLDEVDDVHRWLLDRG